MQRKEELEILIKAKIDQLIESSVKLKCKNEAGSYITKNQEKQDFYKNFLILQKDYQDLQALIEEKDNL